MEQMPVEDWALFREFCEGSAPSFKELFDRHKSRVINLAYRFVRSRETAEDVAQDVFIKIYEKKLKPDPKAKFTTWLYKVTVNASIDRTRRKGFFGISLDGTGPDSKGESPALIEMLQDPAAASPGEILAGEEIKALVRAEIHKLPENLRNALLLYQFENLPYDEIARILGATPKAVERRIYHAKKALKHKLARYLND